VNSLKSHRLRIMAAVSAIALAVPAFSGSAAASTFGRGPAQAGTAQQVKTGSLTYVGSTNLNQLAKQQAAQAPGPHEMAPESQMDDMGQSTQATHGNALSVAQPPHNAITTNNPNKITGWDGLNHFQSRFGTDIGPNQYSEEPPDQCNVGRAGYDLEGVNNALAVYDATNHQMLAGPVSLNSFWHLPVPLIRGNPTVFPGPFTGDINCFFDPASQRYFLTAFSLPQNYNTGDVEGPTQTLLAVSDSANPLGEYTLWALDTSDTAPDDATTHPTCQPVNTNVCFGDQPRIGADLNGLYITVNEFTYYNPGAGNPFFFGAEIYALPKNKLVGMSRPPESSGPPSTSLPKYVRYSNLRNPEYEALNGGGPVYNYSVEPAQSAGKYDGNRGGTEYFLSSLDMGFCLDNRILGWAMTNTQLLNSGGIPTLQTADITTSPYGCPPPANQKPVSSTSTPQPYGCSQGNCTSPEYLNTDDERMQQVYYAHGYLWGSLTTRVANPTGTCASNGGKECAGIMWVKVAPTWNPNNTNNFAPTNAGNGYIVADNENAMYPAIAANEAGQAAISFSMSGTNDYPSTAYSVYNPNTNSFGPVHISGAGAGPEDGFTGYIIPNGICVDAYGTQYYPCARWGDYSAANVDWQTGKIWMAAEYIPNDPRSALANWGTYITLVDPTVLP
jgi:hypothetical protein